MTARLFRIIEMSFVQGCSGAIFPTHQLLVQSHRKPSEPGCRLKIFPPQSARFRLPPSIRAFPEQQRLLRTREVVN